MKSLRNAFFLILFIISSAGWSVNSFDCGSNGSYGALIATHTSGTVTLDLPPDGIFNCTQVRIDQGATIKFNRNALNTPVYILSMGDIEIYGIIDVSGQPGTDSKGGEGGPGGFDGGMPGYYGTVEPGDGIGPGGGIAGIYDDPTQNPSAPGPGAYGGSPNITNAENTDKFGKIYGSSLLFPLVGGSGGGGAIGKSINEKGIGGGGGGGAILLASNTHIKISGKPVGIRYGIFSYGGRSFSRANGSGGAIRLIAPEIIGDGYLWVPGGIYYGGTLYYEGGHGRIRIDTYNRTNMDLHFDPDLTEVISIGSCMTIFPANMPKLDIIKAAGQDIPEGTTNDIKIILGFEDPISQIIRVQARNFTGIVPISVVLIPETGSTSKFDAEIDMNSGNPSYVDVTVQMPKNTLTHIFAWTRSP